MQDKDPMFLRRVFVSHYCNVPYHVTLDKNLYPRTLIDELYTAAAYLMEKYELSPYAMNNGLEDLIIKKITNGEL